MKLESHVLHVFNRLNRGGAELRTIELVNRTDFVFDFLCLSGLGGTLDDSVRSSGHRVTPIRFAVRNFVQIFKFIRSGNFNAVHVHSGQASGPILVLAVLARVPIRIAHFRSDAVGGKARLAKSGYLRVSRLLVDRFATALVGVSPGSLKYGWDREWESDYRCRVIPNGFDGPNLNLIADESSISIIRDDRRILVASVARAEPSKNRLRAIRIWGELARSHPSDLLLVGQLSTEDELIAKAVQSSIHNGSETELIGETAEVPAYLRAADVLLVTSMREGLPGVVLEALALGTPVVASALPGVAWIAQQVHGVSIVNLVETDEVWCAAIVSALNTDQACIRKSFDTSRFSSDHSTHKFLELWELNE